MEGGGRGRRSEGGGEGGLEGRGGEDEDGGSRRGGRGGGMRRGAHVPLRDTDLEARCGACARLGRGAAC